MTNIPLDEFIIYNAELDSFLHYFYYSKKYVWYKSIYDLPDIVKINKTQITNLQLYKKYGFLNHSNYIREFLDKYNWNHYWLIPFKVYKTNNIIEKYYDLYYLHSIKLLEFKIC